jgi:hypothetical protein
LESRGLVNHPDALIVPPVILDSGHPVGDPHATHDP